MERNKLKATAKASIDGSRPTCLPVPPVPPHKINSFALILSLWSIYRCGSPSDQSTSLLMIRIISHLMSLSDASVLVAYMKKLLTVQKKSYKLLMGQAGGLADEVKQRE
jgi:hypothetical protein